MASREQLYCDYITELKMYNPNLMFMDNTRIFKNFKEVSAFSDLEWIDIYVEKDYPYGAKVVCDLFETYLLPMLKEEFGG